LAGILQKKLKEENEAELKTMNEVVAELTTNCEATEKDIVSAKEVIEIVKSKPITDNKEYQKIQDQIDNLPEPGTEDSTELEGKTTSAENNIEALKSTLQKLKTAKETDDRIKELKDQGRDFAKQIETAEGHIALCDLFTRTKSELLKCGVNKHFEITTFKMFQEHINGDTKDVCIPMHNGVPYDKNLNDGHKCMVDLDIINTLSKHYDVFFPIFCDNMESVTVLPEIDTQVFKLIKPEITEENEEYYSKLRTEPFLIK